MICNGTNIRTVFFGLIVFGCMPLFSQSNIFFFIDSSTIIGNLLNGQVYVSETEIAYTVQGNIIFKGDSKEKEQIFFTVDAKDIMSKKVGLVFQDDAKTVQYMTQNGNFFLGDHPMADYKRLLYFKQVNDSMYEVKSGIDTSLLGVIEGQFGSQAELVAAAHLYITHYHLDIAVKDIIERSEPMDEMGSGENVIRPYYDRGMYYVWVWDGEILKPAMGYRPEDEWKFDGRYLKPVWSLDPQSEWEWDGKILKPTWDNSAQNQWIWEDNVLKPYWDPNPDRMWVLEETIVRPMWNFNTSLQWEVTGSVPLPVLALVLLGRADR